MYVSHLRRPPDSGSSRWSQHWPPPRRPDVCAGFCTACKFVLKQHFVRKTFPPFNLKSKGKTHHNFHTNLMSISSHYHSMSYFYRWDATIYHFLSECQRVSRKHFVNSHYGLLDQKQINWTDFSRLWHLGSMIELQERLKKCRVIYL